MFYCASTNGFYATEIHGDNIPSDAVEISTEEHANLLAGQSSGKVITADTDGNPFLANPPAPTQEQVIAQYETALDDHLDAVAKQRRYDNRFTFALRAGFAGPYQAEGTAFAQWMDACNTQAFALLQSVVAGEVELPSLGAFIDSLPAFIFPA